MRAALLADVHANQQALEAVLGALPPVDRLIFLGDLVGYGANPNECCDLIRAQSPSPVLAGNHDIAVFDLELRRWFNPAASLASGWTASVLRPTHLEYLRALSAREMLEGVLAVHGSPRDPVHEYILSAEVAGPCLRSASADLCLFGHTHIPALYWLDGAGRVHSQSATGTVALPEGPALINPGGVGQPRDGDPRAAFAILDTGRREVSFHRVEYDVVAAQRLIHEAGLPEILADRLALGL